MSSGGSEVVENGGVSGSQETSGSGVETSDSSVTGERREVGSSSSVNVDTVGISSSEMAASSGVATSSQEEILDCDLDDDGEISEDLEEGETGDMNPDNLEAEGTTDEDKNNVQEVEAAGTDSEEEIEQPEVGTLEDDISEPSSSTGTRRSTMAGAQGSGVSGYEHDHGDTDSVVPTTPKLALPRRNDGFAEAVSSPQVL